MRLKGRNRVALATALTLLSGCGLIPKRRVPPDPPYTQKAAPSALRFGSAPQGAILAPSDGSEAPLVFPDPVMSQSKQSDSEISAPPMLGGAPLDAETTRR